MAAITVSPDELPSETSWFSDLPRRLPSPQEVKDQAAKDGADVSINIRPAPVRFPGVGILVKWGVDVTTAEGQCLWIMRHKLKNEVPVPEVYGWTRDGEETFIYMELITAPTLAQVWDGLAEIEKNAICEQFAGMATSWRRLKRPEGSAQLSQIGGQSLRDIMFSDGGTYPAGPFRTLSEFHDAFASLALRPAERTVSNAREVFSELAGLTDDVPVVFTHDDLDVSNILVSKPGDGCSIRILAIIDWHQSGWYPEPWELLKAQSIAEYGSEWKDLYLPKIFKPAEFGYYYAFEYISMAVI